LRLPLAAFIESKTFTIAILLLLLLLGAVTIQAQNWTGIFIIDKICNQKVCCCLAGDLVISRPIDEIMMVHSNLIGPGCDTDKYEAATSYPSELEFSASLDFHSHQSELTLTLNSDSQSITMIDQLNPTVCQGKATRSNEVTAQYPSIMTIVLITLIKLFVT
jgi:hypothetical protein